MRFENLFQQNPTPQRAGEAHPENKTLKPNYNQKSNSLTLTKSE
jgi:hypothetical protein